jgi:hypothetical protein
MAAFDMNQHKDEAFYIKLLNRRLETHSAKFPTFRLREFAIENNIEYLVELTNDIDIYFDFSDQKQVSGIEIVTFYDDDSVD